MAYYCLLINSLYTFEIRSSKLAAILINKFGVPVVEDEETVREVVGKEKVS